MRLGGGAANTCGAEHWLCPSTETMLLVCSGQSGPRGFELLPLCPGGPGSGPAGLYSLELSCPGTGTECHRLPTACPRRDSLYPLKTGAINSLDSWWRRKRGSGKTHYSLINMASHRRNEKTTRTPCLPGMSKSIVKYEMPGCLFSSIQITCSLSSYSVMYQMPR